MLNINQIKKLREETGLSLVECKRALEEGEGDIEKAKEILRKWGREFAEKKGERVTKAGIIESYIHQNKKIGVLLEMRCESDFVAQSADFRNLAHEICLQIAAMKPRFLAPEDLPKDSQEIPLLSQPWIKDERKRVKDLIDEYISKLGENIVIKRFIRYEI